MCAPRSGNQKGSVERLVGWVKGAFFKHRKFQDDVDLRAQLAAWLSEVNEKTPNRATKVIPENSAARGARALASRQSRSGKARAPHPDLRRSDSRSDVRGRAVARNARVTLPSSLAS